MRTSFFISRWDSLVRKDNWVFLNTLEIGLYSANEIFAGTIRWFSFRRMIHILPELLNKLSHTPERFNSRDMLQIFSTNASGRFNNDKLFSPICWWRVKYWIQKLFYLMFRFTYKRFGNQSLYDYLIVFRITVLVISFETMFPFICQILM